MFGATYSLVKSRKEDGSHSERWIPVNPTKEKAAELVDPELEHLAVDCKTDKDRKVKRTKIAGINVVSFPCGTILSMEELFGSESLSQVLLPINNLMTNETLRRDVKGNSSNQNMSIPCFNYNFFHTCNRLRFVFLILL